jgi:hypothetical protein
MYLFYQFYKINYPLRGRSDFSYPIADCTVVQCETEFYYSCFLPPTFLFYEHPWFWFRWHLCQVHFKFIMPLCSLHVSCYDCKASRFHDVRRSTSECLSKECQCTKLLLHEIQIKMYTTVNTPKAMSCLAYVDYDYAQSFKERISFRIM